MSQNLDAQTARPSLFPNNPSFSSGPCPKRPGWKFENLELWLGRSHRAKGPKAQISHVIELMRSTLDIPDDYKIGIVPASDTGAFEMALWSMLGARPVDVFAWESFSAGWASDITKHLHIEDTIVHEAPYGQLPDMSKARKNADLVFTWNGTTSGVKVPNADFIADDREGLSFVDATSAVYAQDLPWDKIDVATFSWQKVLGGEAAHGVLILSPRAVERLENYAPKRALPKIFRLTKGGKLIDGIFSGATINTVSMIAIADALDALKWVQSLGGTKATQARSDANFTVLQNWVDKRDWIENLASEPLTRSNSSVCLYLKNLPDGFAKKMVQRLDEEGAAYDIGSYRDAPEGLRIWCGATVEAEDIQILTQWLDWVYAELTANQ